MVRAYILDFHGTLDTLDDPAGFLAALHAKGHVTLGFSGRLPRDFPENRFTFGNQLYGAVAGLAIGERAERFERIGEDCWLPADRFADPVTKKEWDPSCVDEVVISDDELYWTSEVAAQWAEDMGRPVSTIRYVDPADLMKELDR